MYDTMLKYVTFFLSYNSIYLYKTRIFFLYHYLETFFVNRTQQLYIYVGFVVWTYIHKTICN